MQSRIENPAMLVPGALEAFRRTNIVALGIATEGDKLALWLWDGSTENATVAAALLADLVDRAWMSSQACCS